MSSCASILLTALLSAPARAEGAFEPARRMYLAGDLRGALDASVEGLAASPGDAPLERLQRLVLDDLLEEEHGRLAVESAELRRRSVDRTVDVRNALDDCRQGDLALWAGDRDRARPLYERAREILPDHPCWRRGLVDAEEEGLPAKRPRSRPGPRQAAAPAVRPPPQEPPARDPGAAHKAYLDGLSAYLRGVNARARGSLQEAVRLDPSHARAKNLLERLEREGGQ